MKKNSLVIVMLVLISLGALAVEDNSATHNSCTASDKIGDPFVQGTVTFITTPKTCHEQAKGLPCPAFATVERDRCKDNYYVFKQYCEGNVPKEKVIKCPANSYCKKGACQKLR